MQSTNEFSVKKIDELKDIIGTGDVKFITFMLRKSLPQFIYDIAKYEGTTYTPVEVITLLDGTTVGGHSILEERVVTNLSRAYAYILKCLDGNLDCDFNKLHFYNSYELVPHPGEFRKCDVQIFGARDYKCIDSSELYSVYAQLFPVAPDIKSILGLYCSMVYYQFFEDCNKRTSRMYCNYLLAKNGIGLLSISHALKEDYNRILIDFFNTGNSEPLIDFLEEHCLMIFSGQKIILDAYR